MTYLFVATPMYGGFCHGAYATSLVRMSVAFMNAQVSFQLAYLMNESLVTRARDSLAHDFLNTDCTHLMFIDSDIGFLAGDVTTMVEADKDILCGLYPRKEINWEQVRNAVLRGIPAQELSRHAGTLAVGTPRGAEIPMEQVTSRDQPVEILCGGAGFMLIKRAVLENLADKVPEYHSGMTVNGAPKMFRQFFDTSIDPASDNKLLSEDYHFCRLARMNGHTVWAAPWVQLSHTGSYQFVGNLGWKEC